MRILFAESAKYLPELRGAVEINSNWLIRRLIRQGVEVGVLATSPRAGLTGFSANLWADIFRRSFFHHFGASYPIWRAIGSEDSLYVLAMTAPDPVAISRYTRS